MSKKIKENDGFTLVEVIVTTLIVGMFASFAVPSFSASVERMKAREGEQILLQVMRETQNYYLDHQNMYPTDVSALGISFSGSSKPKYFNETSLVVSYSSASCDHASSNHVSILRNGGEYKLSLSGIGEITCSQVSGANYCDKFPYVIGPPIS